MLMIVFGAGASYDSVHALPVAKFPPESRPNRLPLTQDVFADRAAFVADLRLFPRCHPIVPYLRQPPAGETLEQVLQRLREEGNTMPERLRQIAAVKLYLHRVIWACEERWRGEHHGITNQLTLLDQLQRWRERTKKVDPVWFVTFNYDRMLEEAVAQIGVKMDTFTAYVNADSYRLAKLHGSVNWGRELDTEMKQKAAARLWDLVEELIERTPEIKVSGRFRLMPQNAELPFVRIAEERGPIPVLPALAIPVEKKTEFECPEEHMKALLKDLPKIDKVVTIGWRATEQHFMALLKKHLAAPVRLLAVAGGRAGANEVVLQFILAGVPLGIVSSSDHGFSDFLVSRELEQFLAG